MTSLSNTHRHTPNPKSVNQPQQPGRNHRHQRSSSGLSEYAECVSLHNNRLNNLLTAELRFIDKDLRHSTKTIAYTQRQVVTRFATSAVRSALERARLVGDRNAELRLGRRLNYQSADGDNRRLDSTVAVPISSEFRRIMSGKVRLQRFVDGLFEGMGSASSTAQSIAQEDSATVIKSVIPEEASPSSRRKMDAYATTGIEARRTMYKGASGGSEQHSTRQRPATRTDGETLRYGQMRQATQPRVANEINDMQTMHSNVK